MNYDLQSGRPPCEPGTLLFFQGRKPKPREWVTCKGCENQAMPGRLTTAHTPPTHHLQGEQLSRRVVTILCSRKGTLSQWP